MKKHFLILATAAAMMAVLSSCATMSYSMREPDSRVEFVKSDFDFSEQVSAEAQSVLILGIDWSNLFRQKKGTIGKRPSSVSIPVVGNVVKDVTSERALYNLMEKNPGYDVVFYPQYEKIVIKPVLGLGYFFKVVTVKTTARLGKLKAD